jgi:hypothetical protein
MLGRRFAGCVILIAVWHGVLSNGSGAGVEIPEATNQSHQGIIVVPRPIQTDGPLIQAIAEVGVQQNVTFPAGSNVTAFIAEKCGKPSETLFVHPFYWKQFLDLNPSARQDNLVQVRGKVTYLLPGCAQFALQSGEFEVAKGMEALAKDLRVPFDPDLFQRLVAARNFKSIIAEKFFDLARASPTTGNEPCPYSDLSRLFACINTIEVSYINRENISGADRIRGLVRFPAIPIVPQPEARVPLDFDAIQAAKRSLELAGRDEAKAEEYREKQGLSNVIPVASSREPPNVIQPVPGIQSFNLIISRAASRLILPPPPNTISVSLASGDGTEISAAAVPAPIEEDVTFVGAVTGVDKFTACSEAHVRKKGRWPFDPSSFLRIWALHTLAGARPDPQNILIVDTGLDFTYDNEIVPPVPERYYFPKSYFWTNTSDGVDPKLDKDGDGIKGNKGWSGVNLASLERSGTTAINDANRSHGLSVSTLALGGRDLQQIRALDGLPIRLGIAGLGRKTTSGTPIFTRDHITNGFAYATGGNNQFNVINLSLSTRLQMPGADAITELRGRGVVIVAAAGNDGKEIGAKEKDKDGKEIGDYFRVWPAENGGEPSAPRQDSAVVISVGAHNAEGKRVEFSNYSRSKVAVLAPGCMIPSFELRKSGSTYADPLRAEPAHVTGTSFAAPVVSFLVALIMSDPQTRSPSVAKERILVGTDFSYSLRGDAYSSGIINVGKALGHRFDIVETGTRDQPSLRYGEVTNRKDLPNFECSNQVIDFGRVKKIAYDKPEKQVLVMFQETSDRPSSFKRFICPDSVLDRISYTFKDAETGETDTIDAKEALDFIPMR